MAKEDVMADTKQEKVDLSDGSACRTRVGGKIVEGRLADTEQDPVCDLAAGRAGGCLPYAGRDAGNEGCSSR